ncbi:MAG: SDR family oxidoreductase [Geminicoccaceae bacterium]|nr:SDR family oxidoreductase [Geminicoccaceae bacterium]
MDLGLNGRRALVTGASRGLGAAIARTLAEEGAEVVAAARTVGQIEAWARDLGPGAGRVLPMRLDMADPASVEALVAGAGEVDILVGNTGGPPPGLAAETPRDAWLRQFETMAANLFHLANGLLPAMRARGWGRIVVVGSSGIEQPIPNLALSNGVRAAIAGWAKTLAAEVAGDGVTVNMVLPGRIHTDRLDELDAANAERQGKAVDDLRAASRATIPVGRYGRPDEFAAAVAFLCGAQASYVTGIRLRVDGGLVRSA